MLLLYRSQWLIVFSDRLYFIYRNRSSVGVMWLLKQSKPFVCNGFDFIDIGNCNISNARISSIVKPQKQTSVNPHYVMFIEDYEILFKLMPFHQQYLRCNNVIWAFLFSSFWFIQTIFSWYKMHSHTETFYPTRQVFCRYTIDFGIQNCGWLLYDTYSVSAFVSWLLLISESNVPHHFIHKLSLLAHVNK